MHSSIAKGGESSRRYQRFPVKIDFYWHNCFINLVINHVNFYTFNKQTLAFRSMKISVVNPNCWKSWFILLQSMRDPCLSNDNEDLFTFTMMARPPRNIGYTSWNNRAVIIAISNNFIVFRILFSHDILQSSM